MSHPDASKKTLAFWPEIPEKSKLEQKTLTSEGPKTLKSEKEGERLGEQITTTNNTHTHTKQNKILNISYSFVYRGVVENLQ